MYKGYPSETHTVTTVDGYILNLHRIPYGKNGPPTESKGIAFLQHGLLSSSADWIVPGPEKALGMYCTILVVMSTLWLFVTLFLLLFGNLKL